MTLEKIKDVHYRSSHCASLCFASLFAKLAQSASRRPYLTLVTCVVFLLVCCIPAVQIHADFDQASIWNDEESASVQLERRYEESFGKFYRFATVILSSPTSTESILTRDAMATLYYVQHNLTEMTIEKNLTFSDLCLKPDPDGACLLLSAVYYYQDSLDLINSDTKSVAQRLSSLAYNHPLGFVLEPEPLVGGLRYVEGSRVNVEFANAFVIRALLDSESGPVDAWLDAFVARMRRLQQRLAPRYRLTFIAEKMYEDEVTAALDSQYAFLAAGVAAIFAFVLASLAELRPFRSRSLLAVVVVVVMLLVVGATVSLASLVVPVTPVTLQVLPMLLLSIGIDNVFILAKSYGRLMRAGATSERALTTAMQCVGRPIVMSTAAMIGAFLVPALISTSPAIAYLALQVAVSVLLNLVALVTAVAAAIVLDERWHLRHRCLAARRAQPIQKGSSTTADNNNTATPLALYSRALGAILARPWCRLLTCALFVALSIAMLAVATRMSIDFDIKLFFARDGDVRSFMHAESAAFPNGTGLPFFIVMDTVDHTDARALAALRDLVHDVRDSDRYVLSASVNCWYTNLIAWVYYLEGNEDKKAVYEANGRAVPPDRLVPWLADFLRAEGAPHTIDLVFSSPDLNDTSRRLVASRCWGSFRALTSTTELVAGMQYMQAKMANYSAAIPGVFSYSPYYPYMSQFVGVRSSLLTAVAVVLVLNFATTYALSCSLLVAAASSLMLLLVTVNILGCQVLFGVSLNAVSVLITTSCIGISSEYAYHSLMTMTSSMEQNPAMSRLDAIRHASATVGSYLFLAALSSLVGMVVLLFGNVELVKRYFSLPWIAIVVVAAAYGLLFLPVLLSFIPKRCGESATRRKRRSLLPCNDVDDDDQQEMAAAVESERVDE